MFDKWYKKQIEKIFKMMNMDTDPVYTPKFKKFIRFIAFKFNPFILSVASFLIFYGILKRIESSYGMEKVIILVCVIVVMTLRTISSNIKKLTE